MKYDKQFYAERLRDPRWQKMRLEILERDGWSFQNCGDTKNTLHVHHLYYLPEKDPWDYPESAYVALCKECHEYETEMLYNTCQDFVLIAKQAGFMTGGVQKIAAGLIDFKSGYQQEVAGSIIGFMLSHNEVFERVAGEYFADCRKRLKSGKS